MVMNLVMFFWIFLEIRCDVAGIKNYQKTKIFRKQKFLFTALRINKKKKNMYVLFSTLEKY